MGDSYCCTPPSEQFGIACIIAAQPHVQGLGIMAFVPFLRKQVLATSELACHLGRGADKQYTEDGEKALATMREKDASSEVINLPGRGYFAIHGRNDLTPHRFAVLGNAAAGYYKDFGNCELALQGDRIILRAVRDGCAWEWLTVTNYGAGRVSKINRGQD
jgi:hypothetical protein